MANKILTTDEFYASMAALAKEHAKGDPRLEAILLASVGAVLNGPDSPAADALNQLVDGANDTGNA